MRYLLTLATPLLFLTAISVQGCGTSRTPDDSPPAATAQAEASHHSPGQGTAHHEGEGEHMGPGQMGQGRMGQGRMGGGQMGGGGDMDTIHSLLADHASVDRRVVDRPDGVETWTESDDPDVAARIREHVRQMGARLEDSRPIRPWDPLFAEIFDHADAITMEIEDTETGVRVVETSDDPAVVLLIQQHAHRAVSEFVERGMDRAHEPTPLPEGY